MIIVPPASRPGSLRERGCRIASSEPVADGSTAGDAIELSIEERPEIVVLVTGDADFAHLALQLRRRGIRVEVAATAQTLGTGLKGAANEVIDLVPLFETFELMKPGD